MFEVTIAISLKKGITDPEATNILKSLNLLGFDTIKEIKSTKLLTLILDEKDENTVMKKTEEMCQKLLTNPVIHQYAINVKKL
jgi:phosphoribosylformylglycinamidine synthase